MKKSILLCLFILLSTSILRSQIRVEIGSAIKTDNETLISPNNDIKAPAGNPRWNILTKDREDYLVWTWHTIIVRLYDDDKGMPVTFAEVDPNIEIVIKVVGKKEERIKITGDFLQMTDYNIFFERYFIDENITHNDKIEIWVESKNEPTLKDNVFKAKFQKNKSLYQSMGTQTGGFWFPTLQFSTNLESTPEGVPFASMPIGIAWGGKFSGQSDFYIGTSIMANWLVYTQPEDSNIATSNSFNLQGLALGALIDINDVVTIGYAYGMNFKSGYSDPGSMFVIGVGSKFIQFFKKGK